MKLSRNKISYLLLSLLAHVLFVFYAYQFGLMYALLSLVAGVVVFNLAYTLYAHRILTHNHFKISHFYHSVFCTLYSALNFGSVAIYAGVHIKHHQYSDTDNDPHAPERLGLLRTITKVWDSKYKPNRKTFVRLLKNTAIKWQHKHHMTVSILSMVLFPAIIVVGFWLSSVLIIAVHTRQLGYHYRGEGKIKSGAVNIPFLKPLLWGEELHSNHHAKPNIANHNFSNTFSEFDFIYHLGRFFSTPPAGHV